MDLFGILWEMINYDFDFCPGYYILMSDVIYQNLKFSKFSDGRGSNEVIFIDCDWWELLLKFSIGGLKKCPFKCWIFIINLN